MASVKRLCVYCGSSDRVDAAYRDAAQQLGTLLAGAGIELIYGGGRIGLMGIAANAVLQAGGRVTGIIPAHLHDFEIGHHGVSELIVVGSMHERKQLMFEKSDAFAVLPGGLGTLDETFEIITWKQLGLHDKPIVIVDIAGYWQRLFGLIDQIVESGFARRKILGHFRTVDSVEALLPALAAAPEPAIAAKPRLV
jgi:uncharacterized protein (TIGR00730 family)